MSAGPTLPMGTVQMGTVQMGTVQMGTVQMGTVPMSTVQMGTVQTRPAETVPDVEHVPETAPPLQAHIVKVDPHESAAAKVLEARINGTPLEALCGHVWVPSRDPKQLPVCQECLSIYEMYRAFNDGLSERPGDS